MGYSAICSCLLFTHSPSATSHPIWIVVEGNLDNQLTATFVCMLSWYWMCVFVKNLCAYTLITNIPNAKWIGLGNKNKTTRLNEITWWQGSSGNMCNKRTWRGVFEWFYMNLKCAVMGPAWSHHDQNHNKCMEEDAAWTPIFVRKRFVCFSTSSVPRPPFWLLLTSSSLMADFWAATSSLLCSVEACEQSSLRFGWGACCKGRSAFL